MYGLEYAKEEQTLREFANNRTNPSLLLQVLLIRKHRAETSYFRDPHDGHPLSQYEYPSVLRKA